MTNNIRVSVTEIGCCPRIWQYEREGQTRAPPHKYSLRGTLLHRALEDAAKGMELTFKYEDMVKAYDNITQDHFDHVIDDVIDMTGRFQDAQDELHMKSSGLKETKLEYDTKIDGKDITLVAKPDYFDPSQVIDYKSSKTLSSDHIRQLAAYGRMIKHTYGYDMKKYRVLLLGNPKYIIKDIPAEKINEGVKEFKDLIRLTVDLKHRALSGEPMRCTGSFVCGFCRYRHICNGI